MRRTLRLLAALAMVALISAGCSTAPTETGIGNSGGNFSAAPAQTGTVSVSAAPQEQALKFAQCMRDNGEQDFPDPNASGALTIDGIVNGSSLDPNSPAWTRAISACKDLEPAGFTGNKRSPEQQQAALKFAQCIRDNAVQDFPDPAPDAPLVDTNLIPSTGGNGGLSILNAAMQKCRALAGAAGVQR